MVALAGVAGFGSAACGSGDTTVESFIEPGGGDSAASSDAATQPDPPAPAPPPDVTVADMLNIRLSLDGLEDTAETCGIPLPVTLTNGFANGFVLHQRGSSIVEEEWRVGISGTLSGELLATTGDVTGDGVAEGVAAVFANCEGIGRFSATTLVVCTAEGCVNSSRTAPERIPGGGGVNVSGAAGIAVRDGIVEVTIETCSGTGGCVDELQLFGWQDGNLQRIG